MNRVTKLITFGALTATFALAQRPGGPGAGTTPDPQEMVQMRVNMLSRRLSLTEDQKAQATTVATNRTQIDR